MLTEKCGLSHPTAIPKFRLNVLNSCTEPKGVDQIQKPKHERQRRAVIHTLSGKGDYLKDADPLPGRASVSQSVSQEKR